MKKVLFLNILVACIISVSAARSEATEQYGTFFIGAKAWGAMWNSGFLKASTKAIRYTALEALAAGLPFGIIAYGSQHIDYPGMGVLGGPVLGYQTPGKKWSFSLSVMWFSYFQQSAYSRMIIVSTQPRFFYPPIKLNNDIKSERNEVDFAISYSINEYLKIFLGYKFQRMIMETYMPSYNPFKLLQLLNIVPDKIDDLLHNVSPGLGVSVPLGQYFAFGAQAGALLVIPNDIKKSYSRSTLASWVSWSRQPQLGYGLNGEASFSADIGKCFIVQLGYRIQVYWTNYSVQFHKYRGVDIFHGIVLSTVFYF